MQKFNTCLISQLYKSKGTKTLIKPIRRLLSTEQSTNDNQIESVFTPKSTIEDKTKFLSITKTLLNDNDKDSSIGNKSEIKELLPFSTLLRRSNLMHVSIFILYFLIIFQTHVEFLLSFFFF